MTGTRRHAWRARLAVGALAVAALAPAGCGGGGTSGGGAGGTTPAGGAGDSLAAAKAATAQAYRGTNRQVDPTPRPAVKGKRVVVISTGQASISSQIPSDAAVAAAKAMGWQVELYDAKLDPANVAPLTRQAVASGANGIVLDAIDCQSVQQPLREARARGIAVIPIYAFDCNDPLAGGAKDSLFSAYMNFGAKAQADLPAFAASYGADQASYVIASSDNKAKVIVIEDPTFTVVKYTSAGFTKTIGASGGSTVVSTLQITPSDILTSKLVPKIQAELLRHPEATWIKSPYTYVTQLGIVPALGPKAGQVKVMGGEGFVPELDLIRQGKVTAANIISSEWVGWSAIDTMNSIFRREQVRDSGIGWTIADKEHNLPASGELAPPVDFEAAYKAAWGVGS